MNFVEPHEETDIIGWHRWCPEKAVGDQLDVGVGPKVIGP